MKILGIDACNIQGGGGITHLAELLEHADPESSGFHAVVVWGGGVLAKLPSKAWLVKDSIASGRVGVFQQAKWMKRGIYERFRSQGCDLLFAPGGTFSSRSIPYVSMSQNMLPFDVNERRRFPLGWTRFRYCAIRVAQLRSFLNSRGVIFISDYAKNEICRQIPQLTSKPMSVVYHGISRRFVSDQPRSSFRDVPVLLYVSRVNFYKHQWNVVRAVEELNAEGLACSLRLVGDAYRPALPRLNAALATARHSTYVGERSYDEIEQEYQNADAFLFASTCENMPNILCEAMAAGLPIVSSSYGPMPEVLGNASLYFNPTEVGSIKGAIRDLLGDRSRLAELSKHACDRVKQFSWESTADETFRFLRKCVPV